MAPQFPKPVSPEGWEWDSLGDALMAMYCRSKGIIFSYSQPIAGRGGWRRPDLTFWCSCGMDAVVVEHLGMWHDPGYRQKWLTVRKPWYADNRDRYLLFESYPPVSLQRFRQDFDEIEGLLANGGEKLHRELRGGGQQVAA